jgi:ComF family protein
VSVIETISLRWRGLRSQFLDILLPPRCVGCHRVGEWLCAECLSQVSFVELPFCACCGGSVVDDGLCARCQVSPLKIECIRSVAYFEGVLRDAVHRLKYHRCTALVEPLGDLMAAYWAQHPMPADVLVPVPLHDARLRERGFNQAALLAREMGRRVGLVVDEQTLVRHRSTASQVNLNAVQRGKNVHDAFRCPGRSVATKDVLLLDDVCTTGATLEACAVALYEEGGARAVRALTLARAH